MDPSSASGEAHDSISIPASKVSEDRKHVYQGGIMRQDTSFSRPK